MSPSTSSGAVARPRPSPRWHNASHSLVDIGRSCYARDQTTQDGQRHCRSRWARNENPMSPWAQLLRIHFRQGVIGFHGIVAPCRRHYMWVSWVRTWALPRLAHKWYGVTSAPAARSASLACRTTNAIRVEVAIEIIATAAAAPVKQTGDEDGKEYSNATGHSTDNSTSIAAAATSN